MHRKIELIAALALFSVLGCPGQPAKVEENKKELLWEVKLGQNIYTCPAIDQAGNIYATISGNSSFSDISGGKLAAVTSTGKVKWTFNTMCDIASSPALAKDGTVLFGCRDKRLHAVSPEGGEKWSFKTGGWVDASPAIGTDETVYFGSWDRNFYAVTPDGKQKWKFAAGGPVESSAAIGAHGTIYFGSHDKNFYALNPDGTVKWKFATLGVVVSSPAINEKGNIYFTSIDGRLYALDEDGKELWHLWTGGVGESSPVLDGEGAIYLGVNNTFCCVTPQGAKKWWFGYPVVRGSAVVASDGMVFFSGLNEGAGTMYEFSPEGIVKTTTNVGGEVRCSPAIGADGTIIIGSFNLQAWKGSAGLGKGAWPKFRGGPRQTGRVYAE